MRKLVVVACYFTLDISHFFLAKVKLGLFLNIILIKDPLFLSYDSTTI